MAYHQDIRPGINPHVNYEPSSMQDLKEAKPSGKDHTSHYNAPLVRKAIERKNEFQQPGEAGACSAIKNVMIWS